MHKIRGNYYLKPILAVDLNGALLQARPFDEAHKRWFAVMAGLLKDKSVLRYAHVENYFEKVHLVMKRYLGNVDHETRVRFARNLFCMVVIAEVSKNDLVKDFAVYLKKLKRKYSLALITSGSIKGNYDLRSVAELKKIIKQASGGI